MSLWTHSKSLQGLCTILYNGGRNAGRDRRSSSIWKSLFTNAIAEGEAQTIEPLWEQYLAERPSQWQYSWVNKSNPKTPDSEQKVTRAIRVVGYHTRGYQHLANSNRVPKSNYNGPGFNSQPARTRIYEAITNLTRCYKERDVELTKQVHDWMRKSGMEQDTYVVNNLLRVYISCGRFQDARQAFDILKKRSVITWTTILAGLAHHSHPEHAMKIFNQMCEAGVQPDAVTYLCILKACTSKLAPLEWGKEIHGSIKAGGFESNVRVGNALLKMYIKSGRLGDAQQVFNKLAVHRDGISWNMLIGGYAEQGCGEEAYALFLQMQQEGFIPDEVTYMSILNPHARAGALNWVKEIHLHALKAGLSSRRRVGSSLMHMYAKSGSIEDAQGVFDKMVNRDVYTWNVMIGGVAEQGLGHEAFSLFLKMKQEGFIPNAITYASLLNSSASAGALGWVKEVHRHALKAGLVSHVRVSTALFHMYAKIGRVQEARTLFDRTVDRNTTTWNMMIGLVAEHGHAQEAFSLFLQMQKGGVMPTAATFVNLLNPHARVGCVEWVREVHNHALTAGVASEIRVGNSLIHMYAKSGSIEDAQRVFDEMEDRDVITWNVLMDGLAEHGLGHEALQLFEQMMAQDVKPDGFTHVAVLSACSHAGLVEEGRHHFTAMSQEYDYLPSVMHYNCMVDLLGRAGHLEEAKLFIEKMPTPSDAVTWKALLGACRTHRDIKLAEFAAREVLKREPEDWAGCLTLSNIYRAAGKWKALSGLQTMMQGRGIRKEPGHSWIEVDNKIHTFVVGDVSHPEAEEIYAELKLLIEKLKGEGYVPDTRLVLRDIDEEEKELALCSHSEKLAIAYGLMHLPAGKPIRIFKNLRVCSDCHTATKFISKVTGREIVARDASRFHHFKDGLCSCGDYW